jgi:hypothetical protein
MANFMITHARVHKAQDGRQIVRAVVKDRKSDATIALWECLENGRMLDALFQSHRATPFSTDLKRFLMRDLDSEAAGRLIENGGDDWRVTERYADLMTQLERLLSMQFPRATNRDVG